MAVASRHTGKYIPTFKNIRQGTRLLVREREYLEENNYIDGFAIMDSMYRLCGKVVTVYSVRDVFDRILFPSDFNDPLNQPYSPHIVVIDEDGNQNEWCWTPGMFDCILEP